MSAKPQVVGSLDAAELTEAYVGFNKCVVTDPALQGGLTMKQTLDRIVSGLRLKPCWNVQKGHGSFITFEFGKPRLDIVEHRSNELGSEVVVGRCARVHGDWHLWIYCCGWRYSEAKQVVGRWYSPRKLVDRACARLRGQILTDISINREKTQTVFSFDLGGELRTESYDGELNEHWCLYCPDGSVFTFRSDGKCSLRPGNAPAGYREKFVPFV